MKEMVLYILMNPMLKRLKGKRNRPASRPATADYTIVLFQNVTVKLINAETMPIYYQSKL